MNSEAVLQPFHESRQTRQAYLARTQSILSSHGSDDGGVQLLTLPTIEKDGEIRPTSTYILRPLSTKERSTLLDPQQCNCTLASDMVNIKIMYRVASNGEGPTMSKWDMSHSLKTQVRNNCFGGNIILGVLLDGPDAIQETVPSTITKLVGITNNGLIQNSILEPGCSIHKNSEVMQTHVMKYAAIIGCGSVSCSEEGIAKSFKKHKFDMENGSMDVEVGPEAGGGRVVNVKIESTMVDVCHELNMDSNGGTIAPLVSFSKSEVAPLAMNVLCPHSSLIHTPQTNHVNLLPHSSIDSATSVTSALLLPHSTIKSGCTVSHALLQWNATLTSQSDAHHVYLMERSEVGPHSFTANAIYGPDSHVSGGEVHCTIFGPNANSHHQSLLIGILWPLGRGNVGYGSNVGSNHTGRIPDQETSVGEGTVSCCFMCAKLRVMLSWTCVPQTHVLENVASNVPLLQFWGLGCVIKFPVDLTSAPYSIIAAGVQLPPQRITLPFSLITDGPGGMNQLTPGWLLQYSPYTVARSEVKFANRRTAKRHDFYTGWKILRAGVMDILMDARDKLVYAGQQQQAGGEGSSSKEVVYKTDSAIPGLGANQLTEKGRQIGIMAYTDALQRYALRGLLVRLVALAYSNKGLSLAEALHHVGLENVSGSDIQASKPCKPVVDWPVLPWNEAAHTDAEALWKHQHSVLVKEIPSMISDGKVDGNNILPLLLQKCAALEDDHAKRVYKSKSRDDVRGASTVPGYKDVHIPAEKDSVVLAAKKEADDVRKEIQMVEATLGGGRVARSRL